MVAKANTGPRARLQSVDWIAVRRAFTERPERPVMTELANEFGLSVDRAQRACNDEGWPALRAAYMQTKLQQADAGAAIVAAAKVDGAVIAKFTNVALETLGRIEAALQQADARKLAPNTRMNMYNTATFAVNNLANAMHRVGVIGLPKSLKDAAGVDSGNGRWNPQMLQALNQTVQVIVQQATPATPVAVAAAPQAAIPATLEAATEPVDVPAMAEPEPAHADVL
jgi:hypothetical protein